MITIREVSLRTITSMLVKELSERYGLKSTKAIYDRLSALDITLPKKNRKSYATPEIVERLDKLQEHLDRGGSLKDYDEGTLAVTYREVVESNDTNLEVTESNNTELQVREREHTTPQVIYLERERDPLLPNRLLTEAANNNYILNSKQIQEIIGIKPKDKIFTRLGFSFTKVGRDGAYSSWKVERK